MEDTKGVTNNAVKDTPRANSMESFEQETDSIEDISREDLIVLAAIAERAGRYDDMRYYVREAVLFNEELNFDERNMLAVSYKNSIGSRRNSWRLIQKLEQKNSSRVEGKEANRRVLVSRGGQKTESGESSDESGGNRSDYLSETDLRALKHMREALKGEIESICYELIDLLRGTLLVHAELSGNIDAAVYYLKLIGDYYRYLAEMDPLDSHSEALKQANAYYNQALPLAEKHLRPADPYRLSVVLNLSVFLFDMMNKPDQACQLAKRGYDSAIAEVDNLQNDKRKESNLIMELLRDNLKIWTTAET